MRNWYRRLGLLACLAAAFVLLTGCHHREHRKVQVHEEQREGEVHEAAPGEMSVE